MTNLILEKQDLAKEVSKIKVDSLGKMKFGIELENYTKTPGCHRDGSGVEEVVSGVCTDYKDILKFTSEFIRKYKHRKNLCLHSCRGTSSASAHIHRSPISHSIHDHLFRMSNIFQFFFKNSPLVKNGENFLSYRQSTKGWCHWRRLREDEFDDYKKNGRCYHALAVNQPGSEFTIEFRYMDFPKSLYGISLYYYLNEISNVLSQTKNMMFEFNLIELDYYEDLNQKSYSSQFSFLDPSSVLLFNADYKNLILYFAKDVELLFPNWMFWNFYSKTYMPFCKLIRSGFQTETKIYSRFFDEKWSEDDWSLYWKKNFNHSIPEKLIKLRGEENSNFN